MKRRISRILTSAIVLFTFSSQNSSAQSNPPTGCPGEWTPECNIKVKEKMSDVLVINKTAIWPNPSNNYFNLQLPDITGSHVQIRVLNTQGVILYSEYSGAAKTCRFGEGFVPGLYFVQIFLDGKQTTFRVLKL
jgi:hypothetical protein